MSQKPDQVAPEFSRTIRLDQVKSGGTTRKHQANAEECAGLADRMGVEGVPEFGFEAHLRPWKHGGVRVTGHIHALVTQTCVVSLEAFDTQIEDQFDRCFTTRPDDGPDAEIVDFEQLDDDLPDLVVDDTIDLGELASEVLALALPSHPRKPGAVFEDYVEGAEVAKREEEKPNPFAVLKGLKSQ